MIMIQFQISNDFCGCMEHPRENTQKSSQLSKVIGEIRILSECIQLFVGCTNNRSQWWQTE